MIYLQAKLNVFYWNEEVFFFFASKIWGFLAEKENMEQHTTLFEFKWKYSIQTAGLQA